jgi:hypothetical protein
MFCKRRHWSRLWIIQEIVLASNVIVQCGPLNIPWDVFSNLWAQFQIPRPGLLFPSSQQNLTTSMPFKLETRRKCRQKAVGGKKYYLYPLFADSLPDSHLVDLLVQFKDSQCQDIRDKVFGVLSLSGECCRAAVPADYLLGPKDICARPLEHHLSRHGGAEGKGTMILCQKVLGALGMEFRPNQEPDPAYVDRSLRNIPLGLKLSIDTFSLGQIAFLSRPEQTTYFVDLLNNQFLYFDLASEHYCSRISDSLSTMSRPEILVIYQKRGVGAQMKAGMKAGLGSLDRWREEHCVGGLINKLSTKQHTQILQRQVSASNDGNRPVRLVRTEGFLWTAEPDHFKNMRNLPEDDTIREPCIMCFGTSTQMFGCVTHNVKVGDIVCKAGSGLGCLAIIRKVGDSYELTGKGLERTERDVPDSGSDWDVERNGGSQKKKNRTRELGDGIELHVDVATLLYLSGYF